MAEFTNRQVLPFTGKYTKFFQVGETLSQFEVFARDENINTQYTNMTSEGISNKLLEFRHIRIEHNLQFVASDSVQYPTEPAAGAAAYAAGLWTGEADDVALRTLQYFYTFSSLIIKANDTEIARYSLLDITGEKFFNNGRDLAIDRSRNVSYYDLNVPLQIAKKGTEYPDVSMYFQPANGLTLANGGQILLPNSGIGSVTVGGATIAANTGYFMNFQLFGTQDKLHAA